MRIKHISPSISVYRLVYVANHQVCGHVHWSLGRSYFEECGPLSTFFCSSFPPRGDLLLMVDDDYDRAVGKSLNYIFMPCSTSSCTHYTLLHKSPSVVVIYLLSSIVILYLVVHSPERIGGGHAIPKVIILLFRFLRQTGTRGDRDYDGWLIVGHQLMR